MNQRFATCIVLGLFLAATVGCGGAKRASVSGKVTLDGQSVDGGVISFIPIDAADAIPAWAEIKEGRYSIPAETGPTVGTQRVEIRWNRKTGKSVPALPPSMGTTDEVAEAVPARYNKMSELKVELSVGHNPADFELTTK